MLVDSASLLSPEIPNRLRERRRVMQKVRKSPSGFTFGKGRHPTFMTGTSTVQDRPGISATGRTSGLHRVIRAALLGSLVPLLGGCGSAERGAFDPPVGQVESPLIEGTTLPVRAVNAGGPFAAWFQNDAFFEGGTTGSISASVGIGQVYNPAPASVYQTYRLCASSCAYRFTALTPGAKYQVRLHFAEPTKTAVGQRRFDVSVAGASTQQVLTAYDVFSDAGGAALAVVKSFNATASAGGEIVVTFANGTGGGAIVNAVEIVPGASYFVNAGGPAFRGYQQDAMVSGGSTSTTTTAIDTSLVQSPPPQSVLRSERRGTFTYTFPGLEPNRMHNVRLYFAEIDPTKVAPGERTFDVLVNGTRVLNAYDPFAAAGGNFKATERSFEVLSNASGQITVSFASVVSEPKVNAIDVSPQRVYRFSPGSFLPVALFDNDQAGYLQTAASNAIVTSAATPIDVAAHPVRAPFPAPADVYRAARVSPGTMTYALPGLAPGRSYRVRLHFAEIESAKGAVNARKFHVSINDARVLSDFDVFAQAGALNRAVSRDFVVAASSAGEIKVGFEAVVASALISGIEVDPESKPIALYAFEPPPGSTAPYAYTSSLLWRELLTGALYRPKGVVGYLRESQAAGSKPVRGLANAAGITQYALEGSARWNTLTSNGYSAVVLPAGSPDSFPGYAFEAQPPITGAQTLKALPLRALRGADNKIRLTASSTERAALLASGFQDDVQGGDGGIVGWLPVLPYRFQCPGAGCSTAGTRGLAIVIHGGGWQDGALVAPGSPSDIFDPVKNQDPTLPTEERWKQRNWATLAVSYRSSTAGPFLQAYIDFHHALFPGLPFPPPVQPLSAAFSLEDTQWFYAHRKDLVDPSVKDKNTCAIGFSAGGHLSLVLAANNHDIRCAVNDAGGTDLANAPVTTAPQDDPKHLGAIVGWASTAAFGARRSNIEYDPVKLAAAGRFSPNVRILVGNTTDGPFRDAFVLNGHLAEFKTALDGTGPGRVETVQIPEASPSAPDRHWYVHSFVTESGWGDYMEEEDALAAAAAL